MPTVKFVFRGGSNQHWNKMKNKMFHLTRLSRLATRMILQFCMEQQIKKAKNLLLFCFYFKSNFDIGPTKKINK